MQHDTIGNNFNNVYKQYALKNMETNHLEIIK